MHARSCLTSWSEGRMTVNVRNCISDADLSRLWDGDVTPEERQVLQQHLDTCRNCRDRWEQMAAGAHDIDAVFGIPASSSDRCLPLDVLAGYLDETLDPAEKTAVDSHLDRCKECREAIERIQQASRAFDFEGDAWWEKYSACQALQLAVHAPEVARELAELATSSAPSASGSDNVIRLPVLESLEASSRRLGGLALIRWRRRDVEAWLESLHETE